MSRTAVLYTARDVEALRAQGIEVLRAVVLTPSARTRAREILPSCGIVAAVALFTNEDYREAVLKFRSVCDALDDGMRVRSEIPPVCQYLLLTALRALWVSACRMDHCIDGGGPWLVADGKGGFTEAADRHEAKTLAFSRMFADYHLNWMGHIPYAPPPLAWLYKGARNILFRLLPKANRSVHVSRSKHPYGLDRTFRNAGAHMFHLAGTTRGWREYPILVREYWRGLTGAPFLQVKLLSEFDASTARRCADLLRETINRTDLSLPREVTDDFTAKIALIAGMRDDMDRMLDLTGGRLGFSYEVSDGYTALMAERMRARGGRMVIANHNTHSNSTDTIGRIAVDEMARSMHPPELTDVALVWHPDALSTVRRACGRNADLVVCPVVRAIPEAEFPSTTEDGDFVIVYASNFHRWLHQYAWIFEFSDEFEDTTNALFDTVADAEGMRIIARVKFREEVPPWLFEDREAANPNLVVRHRNSSPFLDDLAAADLVVSFSSTTIYQALAARKPVLLFSTTARYFRLPYQSTPPTAESRSAVYGVETAEDLAAMLSAIRAAHKGQPLTDAEIAPFLYVGMADDYNYRLVGSLLAGRDALASFVATDRDSVRHATPSESKGA